MLALGHMHQLPHRIGPGSKDSASTGVSYKRSDCAQFSDADPNFWGGSVLTQGIHKVDVYHDHITVVARYRSSKGRWRIRASVRRIKRIRVKGAVLMAERRWGAQSFFNVRQGFFVVNSKQGVEKGAGERKTGE